MINSDLTANSNHFYFDYKNGKYGYNTDPNRGAGTFSPFKSGFDNLSIIDSHSYPYPNPTSINITIPSNAKLIDFLGDTNATWNGFYIVESKQLILSGNTAILSSTPTTINDPNNYGTVTASATDNSLSLSVQSALSKNFKYYYIYG